METYKTCTHTAPPQPREEELPILLQWLNNLGLYIWVCSNPRAYRKMRNNPGMRLMSGMNILLYVIVWFIVWLLIK